MKKWNKECRSCIAYGASSCSAWKIECGADKSYEYCRRDLGKYYANRKQCNRLLKLWDDANGSIAEWRANDRPMMRWCIEKNNCRYCFARTHYGACSDWLREIKLEFPGSADNHRCYANSCQTEALLKWHDDRYGKIDEKEEAVEDLDFRVGDDVFDVAMGNGVVSSIDDSEYPVGVDFESGEGDCYDLKGRRYDQDPTNALYHGHNLKITVEEKKPVRKVEKWIFLYRLNNEPTRSSGEFDNAGLCLDEIDRCNGCKGYAILSAPIKVQTPK